MIKSYPQKRMPYVETLFKKKFGLYIYICIVILSILWIVTLDSIKQFIMFLYSMSNNIFYSVQKSVLHLKVYVR